MQLMLIKGELLIYNNAAYFGAFGIINAFIALRKGGLTEE